MTINVDITLNTFDDEGNQVDTTNETLPVKQVSDILDHAAQLLVILQSIERGDSSIKDYDLAISELHDAMLMADLVSDDPLPTLTPVFPLNNYVSRRT